MGGSGSIVDTESIHFLFIYAIAAACLVGLSTASGLFFLICWNGQRRNRNGSLGGQNRSRDSGLCALVLHFAQRSRWSFQALLCLKIKRITAAWHWSSIASMEDLSLGCMLFNAGHLFRACQLFPSLLQMPRRCPCWSASLQLLTWTSTRSPIMLCPTGLSPLYLVTQ